MTERRVLDPARGQGGKLHNPHQLQKAKEVSCWLGNRRLHVHDLD
jgi:hypothetical protein